MVFNEKVKAKDRDYLNLDGQIWEGAWPVHGAVMYVLGWTIASPID